MALDQASQALFKSMVEAAGPVPVWEMSAAEVRKARASDLAIFGTPPPMYRAEDVNIPTRDGSTIQARLLVPVEHPKALLVYLHGGGWVLGDLAGFDTLARRLAARWAREQGSPQLAAQILIYPVTDADFSRASYTEPENQTLLPTPFMAWFWDQYIADPAARLTPDAAPLRAADLSGLAPTLVLTARHDILRDEGLAYAGALRAAAVVVDHHDIAGQMHGFFSRTGILPGSDIAMAKIGEFVEKILSA